MILTMTSMTISMRMTRYRRRTDPVSKNDETEYRQDVVDGLHPACFAVMKQMKRTWRKR